MDIAPDPRNQYAAYLGDLDPVAVMRATPAELQRIISLFPAAKIFSPMAPGKWTPREVLAHLADCEIVFGFRLRSTLERPGATLTPFDQDTWSNRYRAYDADLAMHTFLAMRAWNLALLSTVTENDWKKPAYHPERGNITFATIVQTIAGHDINHLQRLDLLLHP